MLNINGKIQKKSNQNIENNRGFLYGDTLFDTLVFRNEILEFFDLHYFRLLAGMRQLRMEIPLQFTQDYLKNEILKTIRANQLVNARVRTNIYRNFGGLYRAKTNDIQFLIETSPLISTTKNTYKLGVYKDNYVNVSPINNIKTTNRLTNILAATFSDENGFDTCLLLNQKKQIAEVIHANIFLIQGHVILTPSLSEGCIKGVIREKLIDLINQSEVYIIKETAITSYDLQKADEVFITNSVIGIQAITHYKKNVYSHIVSDQIKVMLVNSLV
jgi:branched-chain amino acid aminotransferase